LAEDKDDENESQNISKEAQPGMHRSTTQRTGLCDQQKEPKVQTASEKLICQDLRTQ
jgi:hypothetical protein